MAGGEDAATAVQTPAVELTPPASLFEPRKFFMRLSHRILFAKWRTVNYPALDIAKQIIFQSPVIVICDDIAAIQEACGLANDYRIFQQSFLCAAPPFQHYVLDSCFHGSEMSHITRVARFDESHSESDRRALGSQLLPREESNKILNSLISARWLVYTDVWVSGREKPICGTPMYRGGIAFTMKADGGILEIESGYGESDTPFIKHERKDIEGTDVPALMMAHVVHHVLSLSFFHCKNVCKRPADDEFNPTDKVLRRAKLPRLIFKKLDVRQFADDAAEDQQPGESRADTVLRALHLVRGHFTTYTDEAPLFGKTTGRFWRSPHLRGKLESGMVSKRYDLRPGKELADAKLS